MLPHEMYWFLLDTSRDGPSKSPLKDTHPLSESATITSGNDISVMNSVSIPSTDKNINYFEEIRNQSLVYYKV